MLVGRGLSGKRLIVSQRDRSTAAAARRARGHRRRRVVPRAALVVLDAPRRDPGAADERLDVEGPPPSSPFQAACGKRLGAAERRLRRLEERVQTKLPAALQVRARCTRVCARTQKALRGRAERGTRSPGCGMSEGLVQPQEERRGHGQARRGRPLQKIGFAASDA